MLRVPGDRLDLDDRLTEINRYGHREPGRATAPSAKATRRRILASAIANFERVGYDATTITSVARDAGVSASTVYALFDSRAGLGVAVLLDQASAQDLTSSADVSDENSPIAVLCHRLTTMAHFLAPRREHVAPYLTMLVTAAPQPTADPLLRAMTTAIGDARGAGLIEARVDPEVVAPTILLVLATRVVTHPAEGAKGAVRHLADACFTGLLANGDETLC